jgi:acetylornithine/succinyldiaminopimelate/putrescine aminotransferase
MKGLNKLGVENVRGRGLMIAFDLENQRKRDDFIIESLKNGLVLLGAGEKSIRVIPPYIITRNDMDLGLEVIEKTLGKIGEKGFKHSGKICEFVGCGIEVS